MSTLECKVAAAEAEKIRAAGGQAEVAPLDVSDPLAVKQVADSIVARHGPLHAVLPTMRERKDGLIINVSSWAGVFHPNFAGAAYDGSKHAVTAMTDVATAVVVQFCGTFAVWLMAERLHLSGIITMVVFAMAALQLERAEADLARHEGRQTDEELGWQQLMPAEERTP